MLFKNGKQIISNQNEKQKTERQSKKEIEKSDTAGEECQEHGKRIILNFVEGKTLTTNEYRYMKSVNKNTKIGNETMKTKENKSVILTIRITPTVQKKLISKTVNEIGKGKKPISVQQIVREIMEKNLKK